MKPVLSIIAAVAAAAVLSGTASAAPRMWIDQVASPTGTYGKGGGKTTWHVGLEGISTWTSTYCSSSATYGQSDESWSGINTFHPDPGSARNSWSFVNSAVPYVKYDDGQVAYNYDTLSGITARCELTRDVYLGKRPYRESIDAHRAPAATMSRRGCSMYSYSQGGLTIDCRHSRSSGSATWMFWRHRSDRGGCLRHPLRPVAVHDGRALDLGATHADVGLRDRDGLTGDDDHRHLGLPRRRAPAVLAERLPPRSQDADGQLQAVLAELSSAASARKGGRREPIGLEPVPIGRDPDRSGEVRPRC